MTGRERLAAQLAGVWIAASATMGTVALILVRDLPGPLPFRPVDGLSAFELLLALCLVAALFGVLAVFAWHTDDVSWLTEGMRGRLLWILLVGGVGLAGWGFAATVTFGAGFDHGTQVALAYLAGGLPFALVAAMLQRPLAMNLVAVGAAILLVVAGFWVVEAADQPFNALGLYAWYVLILFGSPVGLAG